jgi:hypothetical protein
MDLSQINYLQQQKQVTCQSFDLPNLGLERKSNCAATTTSRRFWRPPQAEESSERVERERDRTCRDRARGRRRGGCPARRRRRWARGRWCGGRPARRRWRWASGTAVLGSGDSVTGAQLGDGDGDGDAWARRRRGGAVSAPGES